MCLNTCLISFLGKLLRASTSSTNLIMPFLWKLYFNWSAIQSACDELDVPPKCMYIVQQKYQFKRISNQTPGILATIISSKYDQNLDINSIFSLILPFSWLVTAITREYFFTFYSGTTMKNICPRNQNQFDPKDTFRP